MRPSPGPPLTATRPEVSRMSDPGASLVRLHLFCAACAIFATGYGLADLEPSPAMSTVLWVGPSVAVAAWLAADGRRTRAVAAYDASLFFYLTWPVTIHGTPYTPEVVQGGAWLPSSTSWR